MLLYCAGYSQHHVKNFLSDARKKQLRILLSYYYTRKSTVDKINSEVTSGDFFLDSGAFSAFTKGAKIDLDRYCEFVLENVDTFNTVAGLDVIGDDVASMKNQNYMENEYGIDAIPCFHYGEDFKYLEHYIDKYDYIAIGGLIAAGNKNIKPFLDKVFSQYVCNSKGEATVRLHGFAMTSPVLMARYPWFSVDSSSWAYGGRNCFVYIPRLKGGEWDFTAKPHPYVLSTSRTQYLRNTKVKEWGCLCDYFSDMGMDLGKSHIKEVSDPKNYELKENEQWAAGKFSGRVEVIEQPGVLTSPQVRNVLNIIYFQEMEKHLQQNPPIFRPKRSVGSFEL